MTNRVVITGLGAISPIGIGKDAFWQGLVAGKSGIDKITHFDASDFKAQIAAEVKDFKAADFIDKKEARRMDRYTQFAIAATKLAFEDAKMDLSKKIKNALVYSLVVVLVVLKHFMTNTKLFLKRSFPR